MEMTRVVDCRSGRLHRAVSLERRTQCRTLSALVLYWIVLSATDVCMVHASSSGGKLSWSGEGDLRGKILPDQLLPVTLASNDPYFPWSSDQGLFSMVNRKPSHSWVKYPRRTMTLSIPALDITDNEAIVAPLLSRDARTGDTQLTMQLFPVHPNPDLCGVATWLNHTKHCADVDVPCRLATTDGGARVKVVVSPSGREMLLFGLQRRDTGTDAVYMWRDGDLVHVDISSATPAVAMTIQSTVVVAVPSDDSHAARIAAQQTQPFSIISLYNEPGKPNKHMWSLEFSSSNDTSAARWSQIVLRAAAWPPAEDNVDLFYIETGSRKRQVAWVARGNTNHACSIWYYNIKYSEWGLREDFPAECRESRKHMVFISTYLQSHQLLVTASWPNPQSLNSMLSSHGMTLPSNDSSTLTARVYTKSYGFNAFVDSWQALETPEDQIRRAEVMQLVAGSKHIFVLDLAAPFVCSLHIQKSLITESGPQIHSNPLHKPIDFSRSVISSKALADRNWAQGTQIFQSPLHAASTLEGSQTRVMIGDSAWNNDHQPDTPLVEYRFQSDARLSQPDEHSAAGPTPAMLPFSMHILQAESKLQTHASLLRGRLFVQMPGNGGCHAAVHGGMEGSRAVSTLLCYDACRGQWSDARLERALQPAGRTGHAGFARNATAFVMFGGMVPQSGSTHSLNDTWQFVFSDIGACTGRWQRMTPGKDSAHLQSVASPSVTRVQNRWLVFGGIRASKPTPSQISTGPDAFFEISVDSTTPTYHIRFVRGQFPPGRVGHSLISHGNDLLLLHGGVDSTGPATDTIIMFYNTDPHGRFAIRKTRPLFRHTGYVGLTTVPVRSGNLFLASWVIAENNSAGYAATFLSDDTCPAGHQRANGTCAECPMHTWGPDGRHCIACPKSTVTTGNASTSSDDCTACVDGYCHGNGVCNVSTGAEPMCACHVGYDQRDNCLVPYYFIAAGMGVLIAAITTSIAISIFVRRRRQARELRRKLRASSKQISKMMAIWKIEWSQIRPRRLVAQGGCGEVWLAELSDTLVTVKKLQRHWLADERSVQEFQREAELMKQHRHPNIVLFLGAGVDPKNELFLVMEYAKRGSLKSLLVDESVAISHADRLRFMLDAAKGMEYLHGLHPPVVHRDLKCSNLLVTERWVVKVADFGTARLMSHLNQHDIADSGGHTLACSTDAVNEGSPLLQQHNQRQQYGDGEVTSMVGTYVYRSPEIWSCQTYGTSADVYSFGLVLWEAYTRRAPFGEQQYRFQHVLCDAVLAGERPCLPDGMPGDYSDLIKNCWQANATERPHFSDIVRRLDQQLVRWC
eukprot:scpid13983/ scgid1304/ Probable serine/threonine-protein kinase drkB; Receptor-like kinase 2; Receptor-like kinase B; Vesicle-associated receptor tyrosine kinase-like protein 2